MSARWTSGTTASSTTPTGRLGVTYNLKGWLLGAAYRGHRTQVTTGITPAARRETRTPGRRPFWFLSARHSEVSAVGAAIVAFPGVRPSGWSGPAWAGAREASPRQSRIARDVSGGWIWARIITRRDFLSPLSKVQHPSAPEPVPHAAFTRARLPFRGPRSSASGGGPTRLCRSPRPAGRATTATGSRLRPPSRRAPAVAPTRNLSAARRRSSRPRPRSLPGRRRSCAGRRGHRRDRHGEPLD